MGDCMLDLFLIILQSLAPIQYPLTSKAFRIEIKCNKLNTAYCFEDWNFDTQNGFSTQKRAQPVPYASRTGPLPMQSWD